MTTIQNDNKINGLKASACFFFSTILTMWFIMASPLYFNGTQMILSGTIAGGKWLLQIIAALIFLENKKWVFIKNIAVTCLTGSAILLPYCFSSAIQFNSSNEFFIGSLIIAVLVMIASYFKNIKRSGVSINWWIGWLLCLAVAITLQLTVVFHVIK